jgi:hypothetical protein
MTRALLFAAATALLALPVRADDEAKGEKVEHAVYTGYFEKNNSGLKGDASYVAFADKAGFDKTFAARPPVMGGKKPVLLPKGAFDKQFVAAVVKRGNSITAYEVQKVTRDGDTLYVQYKATPGPAGSARFASPLIVGAPKEKVKRVVFIENGKAVGSSDVK